MQCPYCKTFIDDDSLFCINCGKSVINGYTYNPSQNNFTESANQSAAYSNSYPVQPNGMLFSKDDYLAQSYEFQTEKKRLSKTGNILIVVGVIIMLVGGIGSVAMIFTGSFIGSIVLFLLSEIVGIGFCAIGSTSAKKKIANLEEEYYRRYISNFR